MRHDFLQVESTFAGHLPWWLVNLSVIVQELLWTLMLLLKSLGMHLANDIALQIRMAECCALRFRLGRLVSVYWVAVESIRERTWCSRSSWALSGLLNTDGFACRLFCSKSAMVSCIGWSKRHNSRYVSVPWHTHLRSASSIRSGSPPMAVQRTSSAGVRLSWSTAASACWPPWAILPQRSLASSQATFPQVLTWSLPTSPMAWEPSARSHLLVGLRSSPMQASASCLRISHQAHQPLRVTSASRSSHPAIQQRRQRSWQQSSPTAVLRWWQSLACSSKMASLALRKSEEARAWPLNTILRSDLCGSRMFWVIDLKCDC